MNTISKLIIAATVLVAVAAAFGCNTAIMLTDGGRLVQTAANASLPSGCSLIGDVAIGIPPDAARASTEDDLILLMRNKAADLGANYVVVDSKERRGDVDKHWVGRARAYQCPEGSSGGADFGQVGPVDAEDGAEDEAGEGSEDGAEGADGEGSDDLEGGASGDELDI